jgi:hypothetical protein
LTLYSLPLPLDLNKTVGRQSHTFCIKISFKHNGMSHAKASHLLPYQTSTLYDTKSRSYPEFFEIKYTETIT